MKARKSLSVLLAETEARAAEAASIAGMCAAYGRIMASHDRSMGKPLASLSKVLTSVSRDLCAVHDVTEAGMMLEMETGDIWEPEKEMDIFESIQNECAGYVQILDCLAEQWESAGFQADAARIRRVSKELAGYCLHIASLYNAAYICTRQGCWNQGRVMEWRNA